MTGKSPRDYAVLVFDMAHTGEPDGERLVAGFRDEAAAEAYAEAPNYPVD